MNENYYSDSFTMKATVLVSGILGILILIGSVMDATERNKPVQREPWIQSPSKNEIEIAKKKQLRLSKKQTHFTKKKTLWTNGKKEQTENWADFLEEIENRGYSIYDAEAEDIWETFK